MPETGGRDGAAARRLRNLGELLGLVEEIPEGALTPRPAKRTNPEEMECVPCSSYAALVGAWRKALRWTPGLDHALAVSLASVISTRSVGDQLWVKMIGPASCGKSTLCEAISVARKYVVAKSTIRGFHSGYKSDRSGEEDHSLIELVAGKTLVTKDGDTLLQSPNLGQILAEARDLYDCTSRAHYRHGMNREYQGIRMTWLLCGTSSLRQLDSSELGERFLDCVIMEGVDDELEDEIGWRVANRADRCLSVESNGEAVTRYEPELAEAMGLTGGYVTHLRENAIDLLSRVQMSDAAKRRCVALGKFVSYMRARPSPKQDETVERELAARLISQHVRLAKCLGAVLNRREVDADVMRRVGQVAMDTARGQTLDLLRLLHPLGHEGMPQAAVHLRLRRAEERTGVMMRFLERLGVAERHQAVTAGVRGQVRWRLTGRVRRLYEEVTSDG